MNIIVNISRTECESLRDVGDDFKEDGGFWFTILKKEPKKLNAHECIYVCSDGKIRARGEVKEVAEIGTGMMSSIGFQGGPNRYLWRREGDWIIIYVGLRWYAKPVACRVKGASMYMSRSRHRRIFGSNEPQLEE